MSSEWLIQVDSVEKSFEIFDKPYQRLLHFFNRKISRARRFEALKGVSMSVHRGEAVGIIGRNGSGKSTLLQIICGTLQPTRGGIQVRGRIAALLELGAGFNPEFSGRENVYLNGSLLGMTRKEIDQRFDSILDFAEIGDHIEQPVKTYSSGMYVRLAFAVAVHCSPEILIVDEALAVGDVYFQRKCHRRIEELRQSGTTLLLVTHSMDALLQICDRGVLLESGEILFDGDCKTAISAYMRCLFGISPASSIVVDKSEIASSTENTRSESTSASELLILGGHEDLYSTRSGYNRDENRLGEGTVLLADFIIDSEQGLVPVVQARKAFTLHARYVAKQAVDRLVFGMQVRTVDGLVAYSTNTFVMHNKLFSASQGDVKLVRFDLRCTLLPGQYFVTLGVSRYEDGGVDIAALDRRMDSIILTVLGDNQHTNGISDMEASISIETSVVGTVA